MNKERPSSPVENNNSSSLRETIKPLIIPTLMILGTVSLGGDFVMQGGKPGITFLGTIGPALLSATAVLWIKQEKHNEIK